MNSSFESSFGLWPTILTLAGIASLTGCYGERDTKRRHRNKVIPDFQLGTLSENGNTWCLRLSNSSGAPDATPPFTYGGVGVMPIVGDWDGDRIPGIGVYDPKSAIWFLRNTQAQGAPDLPLFSYGGEDWIPVVGDWDGDGTTTVGVFDPRTSTWYLRNSNTSGAPDYAPFPYGGAGAVPVVGDWDGDGRTSIGVFDPTTTMWFLKNELMSGAPDYAPFPYGSPGFVPVSGDWNGDGSSSVGVFDPDSANWALRDQVNSGAPDYAFEYGGAQWLPIAADWDGNGTDSIGIVDPFAMPAAAVATSEPPPVAADNATTVEATAGTTSAPAAAPEVICEEMRSLNGSGFDITPVITGCLGRVPDGGTLWLPPGRYALGTQLTIANRVRIATEGHLPDAPACGHDDSHGCAEIQAHESYATQGGMIVLAGAGPRLSHVVINGRRATRGSARSLCQTAANTFGINVVAFCADCGVYRSVIREAVCGTGLAVTAEGGNNNIEVSETAFLLNGVHDQAKLWSDGLTVANASNSRFNGNYFYDNTDVDLIFGGCTNCQITNNRVVHSGYYSGSAFAAVMIHAWPGNSTPGDYTGSDIAANVVNCQVVGEANRRGCGFGLLLGSNPWYAVPHVRGGHVHDNTIVNAEAGLTIDEVHDMRVVNNGVNHSGGSSKMSCGVRQTHAYSISASSTIDRTGDNPSIQYVTASYAGCIANSNP